MSFKTILFSLAFLLIPEYGYSQTIVKDESTKAYLNFTQNITISLSLHREYLETRDFHTYRIASGYTLKALEGLDNSREHMSDYMFEKALEIAIETNNISSGINEHPLAILTMFIIVENMNYSFLRMIFVPEARED